MKTESDSSNKYTDPFTPQQRRRLRYFESRLLWDGQAHRKDVCKVFDVSENHFTRDLSLYRKYFKRNLALNPTTKCYEPTEHFKPEFASGSAEEYLAIMLAYAQSGVTDVLDSIGAEINVEQLPHPAGNIDGMMLRVIVRAIRHHTCIQVSYQSINEKSKVLRKLRPHALAFTGTRWHVRAFDERHSAFRDFVLARFLSVEPADGSPEVLVPEDRDWLEMEEVVVVPNPNLNAAQQEVIAREYGMRRSKGRWAWRVKLRRCLVSYFLHRYRLDLPQKLLEKERIQITDLAFVERFRFKSSY